MKLLTIAGASGFAIIAFFIMCAIYLRTHSEGVTYDEQTMSSIAADPKDTNWVRFFCWTVSALVIPYTLGLIYAYDLEVGSPTIILATTASLGLFFTALTINNPASHAHQIASLVFYISLFVMPLEIAIKLVGNEEYKLVGYFVLSLFIIAISLLLGNIYQEKGKPDGITEAILMGSNAIWVIIYSIQMLSQVQL